MSFRDVICVKDKRDNLCNGIRQSLEAIPLDVDVRAKLSEMLTDGTPVQKIYLIVFAIVRLAGLYEIVAAQSSPSTVKRMENLYYILNEHLMGDCEEGTDAYLFVQKIALMADYSQ